MTRRRSSATPPEPTANGPETAFGNAMVDQLYEGVGLRAVAQRLASLVARSRIQADPHDLGVTISIGGTMAIPGDTAVSIFKRADAALYTTKDGGRNRAEVDPP